METFTYEILGMEVLKWFQEPNLMKFLNIRQYPRGIEYGMHISSYDIKEPDVYYFEVKILKKTETETGEKSFEAETLSKFKTTLTREKIPQVEMYFLFIDLASKQFVNEFYTRTVNTIYYADRIAVPQIEQMRPQIQKYLDEWDTQLRHIALN